MQQIFKIGLITKPQGLSGELKVQPLTDDIGRFKCLKEVLIDGQIYCTTKVSCTGFNVFISLSGVNDRNMAELFRNKFLCVTRENAVNLKKGEYFVADLIGSVVIADNNEIGRIIEVTSLKTDVIVVETVDNRILRFPFLSDLVLDVDIIKGKMIVKKDRLDEVACYED